LVRDFHRRDRFVQAAVPVRRHAALDNATCRVA